MALGRLNLGFGTYAENGSLPTDSGYPNPADFAVSTKKDGSGYSYTISERSAGAFTLFTLGNFLDPTLPQPYLKTDLIEDSKVTLKGNITGAAIGLGYGSDSLKIDGSSNLSVLNTDTDPSALISSLQGMNWFAGVQQQNSFWALMSNVMSAGAWFGQLGSPNEGPGYADKVEIKGDANLTLINTGLNADTVQIKGGLLGAVVLLDGLSGIGGDGGPDAGKDKLEVSGNSNLAFISAGAKDDSITFKEGATAIDVNGGKNNDSIKFEKGMLGNIEVDLSNLAATVVNIQFPGVPLGVVAGGADKDTIMFGGGSSSKGIAIFGDEPLPFGTDPIIAGDDSIIFGKGKATTRTWLRSSLIDLGKGTDSVSFGDYTSLENVIIDAGGNGGSVDTISFSTLAGAATFSATNVVVRDFGLEDKIVLGGITYTGAGAIGNATLLAAGITVVPPV